MPVMGFTMFEHFFRAAGGVDVDRDDIKRYLDFVNDVLYDLLLIGQATAKANVRDVILPWDLPVTKGLQESVHAFERLGDRTSPHPRIPGRAAPAGCRAGRRHPGQAPVALRRRERRPGPGVQARPRRAQGRAHPGMGTHVRALPAAHLSRTPPAHDQRAHGRGAGLRPGHEEARGGPGLRPGRRHPSPSSSSPGSALGTATKRSSYEGSVRSSV